MEIKDTQSGALSFEPGMPPKEEGKYFVLMTYADIDTHLIWLQSVEYDGERYHGISPQTKEVVAWRRA